MPRNEYIVAKHEARQMLRVNMDKLETLIQCGALKERHFGNMFGFQKKAVLDLIDKIFADDFPMNIQEPQQRKILGEMFMTTSQTAEILQNKATRNSYLGVNR